MQGYNSIMEINCIFIYSVTDTKFTRQCAMGTCMKITYNVTENYHSAVTNLGMMQTIRAYNVISYKTLAFRLVFDVRSSIFRDSYTKY